MRKPLLGSILLFVALFATVATARAGVLNDVGRFLGWGWSDGYHARSAPAQPQPMYYAPSPAPRTSIPTPNMQIVPTVKKGVPALPSRQATPQPIPLSK